jgi:hypothetical protein
VRKLLFGETWAVPIGVFATLIVGLLLRGGGSWVAFLLLAGVVATLCAALPWRRQ